jgi:hypothetical protein
MVRVAGSVRLSGPTIVPLGQFVIFTTEFASGRGRIAMAENGLARLPD